MTPDLLLVLMNLRSVLATLTTRRKWLKISPTKSKIWSGAYQMQPIIQIAPFWYPTPQYPPLLYIRVVSTFGSDNDLVGVVRKLEPTFAASRSFSSAESLDSVGGEPSTSTPIFKFVKKTGSSLRRKLVKVRHMALGIHMFKTDPCHHRNCKCCELIAKEHVFIINGIEISSAPGSCSSYNVICILYVNFASRNI